MRKICHYCRRIIHKGGIRRKKRFTRRHGYFHKSCYKRYKRSYKGGNDV